MKQENRNNAVYQIVYFIAQCNTLKPGTTEFAIAQTVLRNAADMSHLTIEEIANDSMTSIASVSRFFQRMQFQDFREFRKSAEEYFSLMHRSRTRSILSTYGLSNDAQSALQLFDDAINNLTSTKQSLNLEMLRQISEKILNSEQVIFVGDMHELNCATVLQLDLLINHIPTTMININEFSISHLDAQYKKTIIFLNIYKKFYGNEILSFEEQLDENTTCILFSQEHELCLHQGITYHYGVENSINDGYYSLNYLMKLLSILIYQYN